MRREQTLSSPAPSASARPRVLFVSYDGLLEPLGQSQILQYIERLSADADMCLLTFEKPEDLADRTKMEAFRRRLAARGIAWTALRYHKAPSALATAYDLALGTLVAGWISLRRGVDVVHARSYPPSVIAVCLKGSLGVRFLFDMRGLWADQRVECGAWDADGALYRVAKWCERRFLVSADVIVSETRAAIAVIQQLPCMAGRDAAFDVVPTCTNLAIFKPMADVREAHPFTLGFVGSLGVWYDFAEMIDCFVHLRQIVPDARLLVVTRSDHDVVHRAVVAAGLPRESCECVSSEFSEVPRHIGRMHAALFLLTRCPSMVAVSPTKLGELLGCGVPCLVNAGVGDVDAIIEEGRAGVVLRSYSAEDKAAALVALVALARSEGIADRCAEVAAARFDLAHGVATYARLYAALA